MPWLQYQKAAEKAYRANSDWQTYMNMIHRDLAPGDFIWTRDDAARFHLGRVTSKWHYVSTKEYEQADLVNICDCEWVGPYTLDDVPGSLLQCRGPFRTVDDPHLVEYTKLLFCEKTGAKYVRPDFNESPNLFKWLSDSACEDLVGLYLQHQYNYLIIPSTSKHSTRKYEFAMIQRHTGEEAAVQVKNGTPSLYCPDYEEPFKVYLYTSGGRYDGSVRQNVDILDESCLLDFATKNRSSLPKTIRRWVNHLYS